MLLVLLARRRAYKVTTMAKQQTPAAGTQARKQNRKPSPVTNPLAPVALGPLPSTAPQGLAALVQALAPAHYTPNPQPPAVAVVAQPAPVAVALRGGLAVVAVAPGKPYRVQAGHNLTWLQQVQALWASGGQVAPVQALVAAGVPAPFVGYMVRRGYAVPCALPAPAPAP
jgi:hypothetical protein